MSEERAVYHYGSLSRQDSERRKAVLALAGQVKALIDREDRPQALYAGIRNLLRDAAENLENAAALYLEE